MFKSWIQANIKNITIFGGFKWLKDFKTHSDGYSSGFKHIKTHIIFLDISYMFIWLQVVSRIFLAILLRTPHGGAVVFERARSSDLQSSGLGNDKGEDLPPKQNTGHGHRGCYDCGDDYHSRSFLIMIDDYWLINVSKHVIFHGRDDWLWVVVYYCDCYCCDSDHHCY